MDTPLVALLPLNLGETLQQEDLRELLEIVAEEDTTIEQVLMESARERAAKRREDKARIASKKPVAKAS